MASSNPSTHGDLLKVVNEKDLRKAHKTLFRLRLAESNRHRYNCDIDADRDSRNTRVTRNRNTDIDIALEIPQLPFFSQDSFDFSKPKPQFMPDNL